VDIGSATNTCQEEDRKRQSPGIDPCPDLERRAGIWVFDANRTGQEQSDGERFATGIRNAVAMDVNPADGTLYVAQHGRGLLTQNWGYSVRDAAEKPAEELFRVEEGDDFGWPYCYFDPDLNRKVLGPEYGGDGQEQGRCAEKKGPLFAFPAHWAPNDLLFHTGTMFPAKYREGVFIAFHGSRGRAPLPQEGFFVVFLPIHAGAPQSNFEIFADGFAGPGKAEGRAVHRPTGLAEGPDGSLYIADDQGGRVWRIQYSQN
jgi:glucose/arabinose dehydrogenase